MLIYLCCGIVFLFWVMVVGVFVYVFFGRLVWYWLIISCIVLLLVIVGVVYELICFVGKYFEN